MELCYTINGNIKFKEFKTEKSMISFIKNNHMIEDMSIEIEGDYKYFYIKDLKIKYI